MLHGNAYTLCTLRDMDTHRRGYVPTKPDSDPSPAALVELGEENISEEHFLNGSR